MSSRTLNFIQWANILVGSQTSDEARYLEIIFQYSGGLSFSVPMYSRSQANTPEQTDSPVNCYLQLVKTNKTNTVQVFQLV